MLSRYQDTHYLKALRLSLSDIIRHYLCVWSHAHSIQMEKSLTFATMKACYSRLCSLCGWEACRPIPFPSPDIHIGCLIMSIDDNINMNIIINISISITFTWVVLFFELFFFFVLGEKTVSVFISELSWLSRSLSCLLILCKSLPCRDCNKTRETLRMRSLPSRLVYLVL